MSGHSNIEIKAKCRDAQRIRDMLAAENALFQGLDHQIDTYFCVQKGRLKLREGDIENYLIYYERPDQKKPKASNVTLLPNVRGTDLKKMLSSSIGIKITVEKRREIYFLDNVKVHIDDVKGLGYFVEIEVKSHGRVSQARLVSQCKRYMRLFGVRPEDLISNSYADLLSSIQDHDL